MKESTTITTATTAPTDMTTNVETLATTLPIAAVEQRTCCNANEITALITVTTTTPTNSATITATTTTTTTATKNHTLSPTKGRSIFNWLKSATKTVETFNNQPLAAIDDIVPSLTTTTTTTTNQTSPIPAHVPSSPSAESSTLLSSYREFRGVQSLRYLWNKRISSSEATNAKRIANAKTKKLNKSISCLVDVSAANSYQSNIDETEIDECSAQKAAAKRRETRTKRAQSLHDCTQLAPDKIAEIDTEVDLPKIDTLRREKDNFYKYKTAEQASKQRLRETRQATSRYRLAAGIASSSVDNGNTASQTGFPAIKASDKGEHIHWLPRSELTMTAKEHEQARDISREPVVTSGNKPEEYTLSHNCAALSADCDDSMSPPMSALTGDSDSSLSVMKPPPSTRDGECCNDSATPVSSVNCSRTRSKHTNTARKYSFKTHAKTYHHSPRSRVKTDGVGAAMNGGPSGYSMVAKLTQQFNEIIQKDKTLLQEVKRNNGVLMSRGGHVYKVLDKSVHQQSRVSPGVSRTNSKAKDLHSTTKAAVSCVRRNISKFEGGSTADKPAVPAKSLQVLRKREELVSKKSKQCSLAKSASNQHNKRKLSTRPALPSSDKVVERPIKLELNTLEVVAEESKTPLETDERSIVEVPSTAGLLSYSEDGHMYVAATESCSEQNGEAKTNMFNAREIMRLKASDNDNDVGDGDGDGDDIDEMKNIVTQQENKIIIHVVHKAREDGDGEQASEQAKKRKSTPAGQTVDRGKAQPLILNSVGLVPANDDDNCDENSAKSKMIAKAFPTTSHTTRSNDTEGKGDDEIDEEKLKQRKNRYAKIYEKFRFRSPFHGAQNKKMASSGCAEKLSLKESPTTAKDAREVVAAKAAASVNDNGQAADAKILAALDVVGQRLKGLAAEPTTTSILLRANDDFEQRLLPNSSFIYQSTTKQLLGNKLIVTQAVNVTLVNTIGGEGLLREHEECHLTKGSTQQLEKVIEIEATKSWKSDDGCVLSIEEDAEGGHNGKEFKSGPKLLMVQEIASGGGLKEDKEKLIKEEEQSETKQREIEEDPSSCEMSKESTVLVVDVDNEKEEEKETEQKNLIETEEAEKEEQKLVKWNLEKIRNDNDKNEEGEEYLDTQARRVEQDKMALERREEKVTIETEKKNEKHHNDKLQEVTDETARGPPGPPEPKTDVMSAQESFLFNNTKSINNLTGAISSEIDLLTVTTEFTEDIYQTLDEVKSNEIDRHVHPLGHPSSSGQNDYESIAGSSEHSTPVAGKSVLTTNTQDGYDGYETFEPPPPPPPPLFEREPPKLPGQTSPLVRNTTDELPALPEPKRKLHKSSLPSKQHSKLPKSKSQSMKCTLSTLTVTPATRTPSVSSHLNADGHDDDQHYYADDENIYDTIKGSHCYESLQTLTAKCSRKSSPKSLDNVSLNSNCYESISQYRRPIVCASYGAAVPLRNAGSTSTISSDQKTNSLYEVSLAAGLLYGAAAGISADIAGRRSDSGSGSGSGDSNTGAVVVAAVVSSNRYSTHSNAASSDGNSDEWVDITDNEADGAGGGVEGDGEGEGEDGGEGGGVRQQFIVVRERTKLHRSPDWSKRVRDKRLQQKKAISCIEDDSDHYYESLSPSPNNRWYSTQLVERMNSHNKRSLDLPRYIDKSLQPRQHRSASAHALGQAVSDDYDSFDTDTDDIYETEDKLKNHHDSGVDIRNVKLPDPPSSTSQVYAMVKKLKNLISNKKSPNGSKCGGSQQKIYENSSQFYVEGNIYQDSPKALKCTVGNKQNCSKTSPRASGDKDAYENTEFHAPIDITSTAVKHLSTSEKNLSAPRSNTESDIGAALVESATAKTTPRSKSKSGKSFKSRLRNSLVGSTFESKQLSILTPTRSTFYLEDASGSGELDSGFSEKFSMADLNGEHPVDFATTSSETQNLSNASRKSKKETKSTNNSQRRQTPIGMRPHEPPPPPPPPTVGEGQRRATTRLNTTATTSWYAECGVFKSTAALSAEHALFNGATNSGGSGKSGPLSQRGSTAVSPVGCHTSWYAEAGLYQTSGASVASSSGSSGVSTGNEASEGIGDDLSHSLFQNEPLYQIYSAAKLQSISCDMEDHGNDSSTDGYEEIGQQRTEDEVVANTENSQRYSRPSALQLVGPKSGPARTLWSEIPEVINSCILPTLTPRERGLQEAKFEIITSEASYLKSLNLLRTHFMNHPVFRDTSVVSTRDRKSLFSSIVPVHECSERLLSALESCWQDNIMLLGLSKRIYAIAEKYFNVYISFCEQQGRMDRTLRRLKESKGTFSQNLDLLESSRTCCGLNLHSFLMLPMQRITRLPLLIDAVFSKTSANDDEYESWKMTLAIMNKIVAQCNEAANRCEQAHEIERIARQLEFPTTVRALAIAPVGVTAPGTKPRFLVKKGELTHLIWRGDDVKLTFGKKFTKSSIYAFLFSDLLVLTKRKSEEQFQVFDYCPRNMLTISSGDSLPQLPTKEINQTGKHLILMTLLENHERKTIELVLSCPSVSEQERWLQTMRTPEAETPGEKLYEEWDCPQVVATHLYESKEPDALNLEVGDVVNVTRKLPDGWYQGERIRDGAIGWFPGNHTEEVNSAHVRARNLKQRYRLLTFTASYLETQKRK